MSMKNVGDLMKRLQKMMPAHVEPAFKTGEELLAWQKEQGKLRSEALERENRAMKMQRTFNRSGIRPLHQNCSLDNYRVECEGQMIALSRARQYVEEFDGNIASFIFRKAGYRKKPPCRRYLQRAAAAGEIGIDYHRRRYYVSDERYLRQPGNQRRAATHRFEQGRPAGNRRNRYANGITLREGHH